MMKNKKNKPTKVISHIDLSKGQLNLATTSAFEVKGFSELTKQEKKRHSRQVNRANAKVSLFHKEYFKYIYLMLKSIF